MCGFTGVYQPEGADSDATATLRRMMQALRHRGPDAAGEWLDADRGIALGHRRLSILDLSTGGSQPMISPSGRWVLSFNGEIYNFLDIRAELIARGARFRGRSDTEVMLAAFDEWGLDEALARFAGMFAFALWDRVAATLHLVRDRLGEKPLYYGWMGRTLLFGSELKSMRAHPRFRGEIARDALSLYLRYGYLPAPYSIYRDVKKLQPGTLLSLCHGEEQCRVYWSAQEMADRGQADPLRGDECEVIDELERQLRRTVRQEMIADVPLGAFLSGGVDSSTLVALMQSESTRPVRTFTIGFESAAYDEAPHARAVAAHLGTAHEELVVTATEAQAVIPRLPVLYDEPFADTSQIPTLLVAELARRRVKVSLSGDGGDELFAGYTRYFESGRLWSLIGRFPAKARAWLAQRIFEHAPQSWQRLRRRAEVFGAETRRALYHTVVSVSNAERLVLGALPLTTRLSDPAAGAPTGDFVHEMMLLDLVTYLPDDILVKVDRATMGVSLESRAPFLDHRIAELAWRVPLRHKVRQRRGKWVLRQLLYRFLPPSIVDRPKMGFGVPIAAWMRGPLRSWARDLLAPGRIQREGFFDAALLQRRWSEHDAGTHDFGQLLWSVLMFQAWLDEQRTGAR